MNAEFVQHLTSSQSRLYAYILTLLGPSRDAADVLQETNAVLWAKVKEYDPSRPFIAWAYRFAQLQVMAHRKRLARDRLLFDEVTLSLVAAEYVRQDHGDRQLEALEGCLEKLSSEHRELLDQRYRDNLSVNDMAVARNSGENAISGILYRIRKSLAECIEYQLSGGSS